MRISDWSSDVCSSDLALPTLQPWMNTTAPPAERFVARRNPFFHRVDAAGRQLPYIDEVILARTEPRLIAAKAAAGETDLPARGLAFQDGAALKLAAKEGRSTIGRAACRERGRTYG